MRLFHFNCFAVLAADYPAEEDGLESPDLLGFWKDEDPQQVVAELEKTRLERHEAEEANRLKQFGLRIMLPVTPRRYAVICLSDVDVTKNWPLGDLSNKLEEAAKLQLQGIGRREQEAHG